MSKASDKIAARDAAREELRALLPVGSVVNVIQRHVSSSGMTRHLSLFVGVRNVTHLAAQAMGEKVSEWHGQATIKVGGCGMDMHFATVYDLSRSLYPNGHPCIGQQGRCPSNDHTNEWREPNYSPDRIHSDGGYALSHRTL